MTEEGVCIYGTNAIPGVHNNFPTGLDSNPHYHVSNTTGVRPILKANITIDFSLLPLEPFQIICPSYLI